MNSVAGCIFLRSNPDECCPRHRSIPLLMMQKVHVLRSDKKF
jgi:hypothetical protein